MNKTTLNPKTTLLLGAGLDVLHFESREWLETINFWQDEIKFFDNLLKKKVAAGGTKQQYAEMLNNLDKIHQAFFETFEDEIIAHEKMLSKLQKGEKGISDGAYREKHRQLRDRMQTFKSNFHQFKKIVFNFAKGIDL